MELLHPYLTNVETEVESSYMGYPTLVIECPKKDLNLYLLDFKCLCESLWLSCLVY